MSFHVGVASISQEVSFEDGSTANYVVLVLPSGQPIKALVTDEGAAALIHARLQPGSVPTTSPPPAPAAAPRVVVQPAVAAHESKEYEGAVVFGGPVDEEEESPAAFWPGPQAAQHQEAPPAPVALGDIASDDPSRQAAAYRKQQSEEKKRRADPGEVRTVPKDEYGYPVVRGAGQDPNDVMGGSGTVDEDGVGQL